MEFTGKITVKTPQITVGANNTPKISLILEEQSEKQYKESIMIDFVGDEKVALLDNVLEGSEVTVSFNTRATEYSGRYYNNLNGWRITNNNPAKPKSVQDTKDDDVESDLPF